MAGKNHLLIGILNIILASFFYSCFTYGEYSEDVNTFLQTSFILSCLLICISVASFIETNTNICRRIHKWINK